MKLNKLKKTNKFNKIKNHNKRFNNLNSLIYIIKTFNIKKLL